MIKLLLRSNHYSYDNNEKALCQALYYKNSGAYNHLRSLLDRKLPSVRTLIKWNDMSSFNVGVVREVTAYLIKIRDSLEEKDKEIIMGFDEMDGKRCLLFDSKRDMFVGFEHVFERRAKLAKKFLTVLIRGLSGRIGNLILANYATANGVTGNIFINYNKLFTYLLPHGATSKYYFLGSSGSSFQCVLLSVTVGKCLDKALNVANTVFLSYIVPPSYSCLTPSNIFRFQENSDCFDH